MGETSHTRVRGTETFVIVAMVLSLFGPYLQGGVRTDQLVIYLLAAAAFALRLPFMHLNGSLRFMVPWAALVAFSLFGVLFPLRGSMPWRPGGVLAGLDNLALPLAVMLIVWCCVKATSAEGLLRKAGKLIVWGISLNAVIAILDTRYDLTSYLRPFWAKSDAISVVAARAEDLGRVSGIINQPSSAGLAYSLAGLLAIYLYGTRPRKLYLALALITVGGMLTVSKIFILIGAPLILLYMWKSRSGTGKTGMLFAALVIGTGVVQSGYFEGWEGANYLARLIAPPESQTFISFYSAGRWAEGSPMLTVTAAALEISPLIGVGAGGWQVAYDSAWTQAIVVAGALGALCLAAVLAAFFRLGKATVDPARRRFTFFLAWLLLASSFGVPALTTNRVGAMVWIVATLLVLAHREATQQPSSDASESHSTAPSRSGQQVTSHRSPRR